MTKPGTPAVYPGLVKLGVVPIKGQERLLWQAAPSEVGALAEVNEAHGLHEVTPLEAQAPRVFNPNSPELQARLAQAPTQVAVAILMRTDGAFLMTSRPPGKVYAGYWEFPGGKFEGTESLGEALAREIQEELGLEIRAFEPWCVECVLYPHALVELHFCRVTQWGGEMQMREGQAAAWQTLPLTLSPVLPGAYPVLDRLARA